MDKAQTSVQTAANRFIVPPAGNFITQATLGFYQELLAGVLNYEQLGSKLVSIAEQARALRQVDQLSKVAPVLINLPLKKYQAIGQYYLALNLCYNGLGDIGKAQALLENVACAAPSKYRAEALLSLSAIAWLQNKPEETVQYCLEVSRASAFNITTLQAFRGIAVLKSRLGDHHAALRDLEKLYPLMKHTAPHVYFDYMNSLAVELCEVGRLQEAKNVSTLICSSPFAPYYKEWQDTLTEVNQKAYKSRSTVRVSLPSKKPEKRVQKAKILLFPQPQKKSFMRESFSPPTQEETQVAIGRAIGLDPKQMLALIIKIVAQNRLSDDEIFNIVSVYYDAIISDNTPQRE